MKSYSTLLFVLACVVGESFAFSQVLVGDSFRVGSIGGLVGSQEASPTVQPTEEVFASPRPIQWDGRIVRMFLSGEALEMATPVSPLGFAYLEGKVGEVFSLTEGMVTVEGVWTGTSCQYGRCAAHVEVESISPAKVELY